MVMRPTTRAMHELSTPPFTPPLQASNFNYYTRTCSKKPYTYDNFKTKSETGAVRQYETTPSTTAPMMIKAVDETNDTTRLFETYN